MVNIPEKLPVNFTQLSDEYLPKTVNVHFKLNVIQEALIRQLADRLGISLNTVLTRGAYYMACEHGLLVEDENGLTQSPQSLSYYLIDQRDPLHPTKN